MGKQTPETALKSQVKGYLDLHGIFHFPLMQGVASYKGLPDRVMHWPYERVVYLEIKTPKGRLSEHQMEFQHMCLLTGIPYWVIRSLDDLINHMGMKDEVA